MTIDLADEPERAEHIRLEGGGLKCDFAGCGWADMTIPRTAYPAYRNAACPNCGSNILTDADWRALRRLERVVAFINAAFFWLKPKPGAAEVVNVVTFDGTGKVTVSK
jgi:DNA-directed RNA polymerase subunit RPC12/RpoP